MSENGFFQTLGRVRLALAKAEPREAVLLEIQRDLEDPDVRREFWRIVPDASWIPVLTSSGIFDGVGRSEFPPFANSVPALQYLLRTDASTSPSSVAAALHRIPINHPQALKLSIDLACKLPAPYSTAAACKVVNSIEYGMPVIQPECITRLVSHLVGADQEEAALLLCRTVYRILPSGGSRTPKVRMDDAHFLSTFSPSLRLLAKHRPAETLRLAMDCLQDAVLAKGYTADEESDNDYSTIWRPAIEDHQHNQTYDFSGSLVGPVRDVALDVLRSNVARPETVVEEILRYKFLIFRRLALHLLSASANDFPELARRAMRDERNFNDPRLRYEYSKLLAGSFNLLNTDDQERFYSWIANGPSEAARGRDTDNAVATVQLRMWQYQRLSWVAPFLNGTRQRLLRELEETLGKPETFQPAIRSVFRVGHVSPIPAAELIGKDPSDVILRIKGFIADNAGAEKESLEGLAEAFGAAITSKLDEYSRQAEQIGTLPYELVRVFFSAMQSPLADRRTGDRKTWAAIDLDSVLDLALEVSRIPSGAAAGHYSVAWLRETVGDFVSGLLKASPPLNYRARIWEVLTLLIHDTDRSNVVEDESQDPRLRDFLTASINTPRSKAMHAVLEYARWVAEALGSPSEAPRAGGFESLPEVRTLLEDHLDPLVDPSFAVRAVYGWHWGLLYWLDPVWLTKNADRICEINSCGEPAQLAGLGWAAWNTFLVSTHPHAAFFKLLRKQFITAVELLDIATPHKGAFTALSEHLMVLYGRGDIAFGSDGLILERFFARSPRFLRVHAIGFVGRNLHAYGPEMAPTMIERFQGLWDFYWERYGVADAAEKTGSPLFGYWFASGVFPEPWGLLRLERFLAAAKAVEPDDQIVGRLSTLDKQYDSHAMGVLYRMIEGDVEGWRALGWLDPASKILRRALASPQTRQLALDAIDMLGRRGHMEVEELLNIREQTRQTR